MILKKKKYNLFNISIEINLFYSKVICIFVYQITKKQKKMDILKKLKVISVGVETLVFDNGVVLGTYHEHDCSETHYLSFKDLSLDDFDGLEFDLSNESFFRRIVGYGIELIPLNGWSVRVHGYGMNNGWYSSNMDLEVLVMGEVIHSYDIKECQDIDYDC